MVLAKVIGEIVSTAKIDRLIGQKFLITEIQRIEHGSDGEKIFPTGATVVANDPIGAGRGEYVLVVQGSSARMTDTTSTLPTDGLIIGIIDSINVEEECVYRKENN